VVAAIAVGVGFPARLLDDTNALALGALALGAVLWALLAPGLRSVRRTAPGIAVGGIVLAVAVTVATAGVSPSQARIDWRGWDPFAGSGRTTSLRYVWDATYAGIEFPARPTVVLRVRAPKRAEYWRVSTLETFAADRWIENLYPVDIGGPRRTLPADPLVPSRDAKPGQWLRQVVTVEGLEDDRIAAASQPARIDAPSLGRLSFLARGSRASAIAGGSAWSIGTSPTSGTSRCGRTGRSGRRHGGAPRGRAPRTRRRSCSSAGSGVTEASSTRSGRRSRHPARRRSSTSSR
jgi:hypothetical protein